MEVPILGKRPIIFSEFTIWVFWKITEIWVTGSVITVRFWTIEVYLSHDSQQFECISFALVTQAEWHLDVSLRGVVPHGETQAS